VAYGLGQYGAGPYGILPPLPATVAPVVPEDYLVLVTDRDLNVVGDPITCWSQLDVTLRFNEPGSGILYVPAYDWVREQMVPGNRIVVIRNGQVLIAGPWEEKLHERSDDGENAGVGRLTVAFADDLASLAARCVYPEPNQTPETQVLDFYEFTGNAETSLRQLADGAGGPGALPDRRIPRLAIAHGIGVGTNVVVKAQRHAPWGDVARDIAQIGGNLGFRIRQDGNILLFEVYLPTDKSSEVRFSFGLGNLRYVSHEQKAPTATAVAVGGQGEGAERAMIERVNVVEHAAWGRFEKFVARGGSSPLQELQDDGDLALAEGAATVRMTANVSDSPDQQFGVHYRVGDIVAIEPADGEQIADVVRVVHLQVHATSGEYVAATVGNQSATTDPMWLQKTRDIESRLGRVERAVTPG
jgi:hypothetical protein